MRRMFFFALTFVLPTFVLATAAQAQEKLFFNAAMFYSTDEGKYDDTKLDQTSLYYHVGVGISLGSGVMIGGKYIQLDDDAKDDDDESTNVMTAYGLSVGYMHKSGIGLMGTYLLEPERELSFGENDTATWNGGDGYVIDIGYYFNNNGWAIGPQISVVNAKYKKVKSNGQDVELDSPYEETFTYPYVSLYFFF